MRCIHCRIFFLRLSFEYFSVDKYLLTNWFCVISDGEWNIISASEMHLHEIASSSHVMQLAVAGKTLVQIDC